MLDVKEQVNKVGYAMAGEGLKFEHIEKDGMPAIVLGFGGSEFSYERLAIALAFDLDGEGARARTSPIANVPDEKAGDVLCLVNDLNGRFRWVRFYLSDSRVLADCDIPLDEQCSGFRCVEAIVKIAKIVDIAYPEIMSTIWG